jgi:hypothetical protein
MIAIKLMSEVSHGLGHIQVEYGDQLSIVRNAEGLVSCGSANRSNACSNPPPLWPHTVLERGPKGPLPGCVQFFQRVILGSSLPPSPRLRRDKSLRLE